MAGTRLVVLGDDFGLLDDQFGSSRLLVRRIAMLEEESLDSSLSGTRAFKFFYNFTSRFKSLITDLRSFVFNLSWSTS